MPEPENMQICVFCISCVFWGGHFFRRKFFLKKPSTPEYAQVLVVTCPKLNSVAALLSPPPTIAQTFCSLRRAPQTVSHCFTVEHFVIRHGMEQHSGGNAQLIFFLFPHQTELPKIL